MSFTWQSSARKHQTKSEVKSKLKKITEFIAMRMAEYLHEYIESNILKEINVTKLKSISYNIQHEIENSKVFFRCWNTDFGLCLFSFDSYIFFIWLVSAVWAQKLHTCEF